VKEDAEYSIAVTGPNGLDQTFTGILDCQTAGEGGSEAPEPSAAPSPAGDQGDKADDGTNLAETGSNSATPVIAGVAVALVVLGGVTMLVLRKRKSS
jgi:LPXTG-motif cell wall-anchored protein